MASNERLYIVSGPPGYVCLTRAVGPHWASQENYIAQVTPDDARRITVYVSGLVDELERLRQRGETC